MALRLTSSTAPGTVFTSREELASHYRSDWHQYNLRRRQAGLTPVTLVEFQAKVSAARIVQLENKTSERSRAHLKQNKKQKNKEKEHKKEHKASLRTYAAKEDPQREDAAEAVERENVDEDRSASKQGPDDADIVSSDGSRCTPLLSSSSDGDVGNADVDIGAPDGTEGKEHEDEKEEGVVEAAGRSSAGMLVQDEIDPRRCLFDRHLSATVHDNVRYMHRHYGFFLPDAEHLVDLSGLVGYCHEKIQLGHTCLWCQQQFASSEACVAHMKSKLHTKIRYESGIDLDEWDVFYDFGDANREFLSNLSGDDNGAVPDDDANNMEADAAVDDLNDSDDDEWEDVSDDDNDDDDDYDGYEQEVGRMGITITDLGEMVFPDGRIVGHRSLRRYYRQNLVPYRQHQLADASPAVRAARIAAGDRLYRGQVYNVHSAGAGAPTGRSITALDKKMAAMGIRNAAPTGRTGHGILVPVSTPSNASSSTALASPIDYTQLSMYRYRAAVRKARYGESYGRRLWLRSNTNLNRMDKKANRLANGVSVAHAAR